ncbi:MAG TPA: HlyD family efflux transporter periplasmic adaptor subunit [Phycisphaerales bacterium]|nr:HlyD family efflux transporter periplasmic adaptor subunit [Phycisphaerales bacterium]
MTNRLNNAVFAALPRRRTGLSTPIILGAVLLVLAAAVGVLLVRGGSSGDRRDQTELFTVVRGEFDVTVPSSGELVAMHQVEVRNRLESRATISEIVAEGKTVRAGDLLMRLNDEELRNRIKDAEDAVKTAESQLIASEATLAIRESSAKSERERAELQVDLATLALLAWQEGEVVSRRQQLRTSLETAEINYERLRERYHNSIRLHEREFISGDELKRDEIAMIEAKARFDQATVDIEVYEQYTYQQQEKQKRSDLEQARAELERVQQRHEAELNTAKADLDSRRYQLISRQERLRDLQTQLEFCTVRAPTDGLVVYASSLESGGGRRGMGGMGDPPQVGTDLSRNELVMILPDTSRMVAAVKINEALSGLIRPGQRARIVSDAMPNVTLTGEVLNVGVLAESGGWRDPNRRDYTVRILIDGGNEVGLRPSMRCRAEIYVDRVENALHVPVQAVFREGRRAFVYVPVRGGYQARTVRIGRSSELYVEIREGLEEGEQVLTRRPTSSEVVREEGEAANGGAAQPMPNGNGAGGPVQDMQRGPAQGPEAGAPRQRGVGGQGGPGNRQGAPRGSATESAPANSTESAAPASDDSAPAVEGEEATPAEAPKTGDAAKSE